MCYRAWWSVCPSRTVVENDSGLRLVLNRVWSAQARCQISLPHRLRAWQLSMSWHLHDDASLGVEAGNGTVANGLARGCRKKSRASRGLRVRQPLDTWKYNEDAPCGNRDESKMGRVTHMDVVGLKVNEASASRRRASAASDGTRGGYIIHLFHHRRGCSPLRDVTYFPQ